MRKALAAGMAALTFGGAIATAALPSVADARPYRYYGGHGHYHRGNDAAAAAIVGGIAGLAIGSAIAGNHPRYYGYAPSYYGGYGYAPDYYGGYGYAAPYATCLSRDWVWDPYIGRRVLVTRRYAC